MKFPREKPNSIHANGIQEIPGGCSIQLDTLTEKSFIFGETRVFGETDTPSTHCFTVNTCGAISSPKEQGTLSNANLESMTKIKKF